MNLSTASDPVPFTALTAIHVCMHRESSAHTQDRPKPHGGVTPHRSPFEDGVA